MALRQGPAGADSAATLTARRAPTLRREFSIEQLPLIAVVLILGFASAYLQHGFLPGGEEPFPLAGVRVPVWHIIWMGFWTGYTMAVVGEAAGIFALPYTMSVLQFSNIHVTPTTQLLTFLNPFGALFGFRRSRQWNLEFALSVCLGGVAGGLIGPFIRLTVLSDVKPFTFVVGLSLAFAGFHLIHAAVRGFRGDYPDDGLAAKSKAEARSRRDAGLSPAGLPTDVSVETLAKDGLRLTIGFWGHTWTVNQLLMFITGALVGIISSALGVGGGFLLVPIFAAIYRLPMYVLVAATIPYVIILSGVGLLTYGAIMPALVGTSIQPEWSWGFFAAAGGILGSWCAAKTQRFVPEHLLKLMLGAITGVAGVLYVIDLFVSLPFRL